MGEEILDKLEKKPEKKKPKEWKLYDDGVLG